MAVAGLVLAAGLSRRMGQPKQLLPWGETTVLGQVLAHVSASALETIYVVTGHEATAVSAIAQSYNLPTIYNPNYKQGMLTSLQAGIRAVGDEVTAVLVLLADQPLLQPEVINMVLAAGHSLARPVDLLGKVGHPVLIGQPYFAQLLALPPSATPRHLLKHHPVHLIPVATSTIHQDLDTPEAYQQALDHYASNRSSL